MERARDRLARGRGGAGGAGDAEVGELHRAARVHEDVAGLDVPVHEPGLVGGAERRRRLADDLERLVGGQAPPPLDPRLERLAVHPLHHDVGDAAVLADLVDGDDARVLELGRAAGLGQDLLAHGGAVGARAAGVDELDRHGAVEGDVARLIDPAHAAAADQRLETAGAERGSNEGIGLGRGHVMDDNRV